MAWKNEDTLKFLDIYQKEPIIWDPSHKQHKNRNDVYDAWKRIQTEFFTECDLKCSIEDLKKKRDSIMATFRNCKSKVKSSEKSGAGLDDVYIPHWFAFQKMAGFLMNHDSPKETINSENIQLDETEISEENYKSQSTIVPQLEQLQTGDDNEIRDIATVSSEVKLANAPITKKRKVLHQGREDKIYEKMESAYNMLKQKSTSQSERSECAIYGELVAKRLEKMEPSERDYVMHEMDNVMYQAKLRFSHNRHYTSSFPSTPLNSTQTSLAASPLPSTSTSHIPTIQYSDPSSVERYIEEQNTREFYESFTWTVLNI